MQRYKLSTTSKLSLLLFALAILTYILRYVFNVFLANHLSPQRYGDFFSSELPEEFEEKPLETLRGMTRRGDCAPRFSQTRGTLS